MYDGIIYTLSHGPALYTPSTCSNKMSLVESKPSPMKIFIKEGLPPYVTEEQIRQHASRLGVKDSDILDIAVHRDVTGLCVGYAYITCSSAETAIATTAKLNKSTFAHEYKLKVYHSADRSYNQFVPVNWPESHRDLVLLRLRLMTSKERELFASSLPAKISVLRGEIVLLGNQNDITKSQDIVKTNFLSNLQHQVFTYLCMGNSECKSQIERFVLIPWRDKLQFYYSMKDRDGGILDVSIFSQFPDDFRCICNHMQVSF